MHSKGLALPRRTVFAGCRCVLNVINCFKYEKNPAATPGFLRRNVRRGRSQTFGVESSTQLSTGNCAQPAFSLREQALGGRSEIQCEPPRLSVTSFTLTGQ